jgi:hypothetical protein
MDKRLLLVPIIVGLVAWRFSKWRREPDDGENRLFDRILMRASRQSRVYIARRRRGQNSDVAQGYAKRATKKR